MAVGDGSHREPARCRHAVAVTAFLVRGRTARTAVTGLVAAAVLGTAVARSGPGLRWYGVGYAVLLAAFAVTGFAAQPLQPVAGFGFAVATAALAVRLPARIPASPRPHSVPVGV